MPCLKENSHAAIFVAISFGLIYVPVDLYSASKEGALALHEKIRKKQTHSLEKDEAVETERPKAQVIDLMEALKNSLKRQGAATRSAAKKSSGTRRRA